MTIKEIVEINNPTETKFKVMREKQDIYVPNISNLNISRRNGMVYVLSGSGGSGKTNLLLNLFKSKDCYRNKFHNLYYFCPEASFASLDKHPFLNHDKVYHELDVNTLEGIYQELVSYKVETKVEKQKKNKKNKKYDEDDNDFQSDSEEEKEIQYSAIIIDDMADILKTKDIQKQLNKMIIKSRHIGCSFIFTLQSYLYFPKMLRKQITYTSLFRTKNIEEFNSIAKELLHLNKEDALTLFNFVFNKPYNHLDIDTTTSVLYKNFNLLELKN
jgi:type II secretory ATPase GspE/PulE/Tfp pilus assembly ATPase PilB-like protein